MHRFITAALFVTTSLTVIAQTPASTFAPPDTGLLVNYTYWPTQYVQWVGTELPYTMIELDVDNGGKQPLLYVTLTERSSGKRVHYTNSDALIAFAKAQGEEAHKTEIAFEAADTTNPGSVTSVRFSMADGKPLQWRFVQGSDISEQGSGLTPLPEAKIPIFAYREEGAVAGEGTALQIGDTVSTAEVWKEISQPPYFVGYRGAVTSSAHMLVFLAGKQAWTIASSPASITAGATWELVGDGGNHRTLHIDKVDGAHVILTGSDRFAPSMRFTLEATRSGDAWSIERVRYAPAREGDKHFVALQFATPLSSATSKSDVAVLVGKKKTIATGTVSASGTSADHTLTLDFATPAWSHGKTLTEETASTATSISTTAHP